MEAIFLVCGAGGPQLKRNPLGGGPTYMPHDPDAKARQIYAARWADYIRYKIDTSQTAPVAFVVDARTQESAQQIAAELADGKFDISRKWWPFGRRWRLMAKTQPMPLARASVDGWFEGVLRLLNRYDAEFFHWVPLQGTAA